MPTIAYSVIATLPDAATASEYSHWLTREHVADVLHAGASSASVVRVIDPAAPIQIEARYIFASKHDFDSYIERAAPALRAEGLRRFPASRGITFQRRVGEVIS
jgi:hypothetical protein